MSLDKIIVSHYSDELEGMDGTLFVFNASNEEDIIKALRRVRTALQKGAEVVYDGRRFQLVKEHTDTLLGDAGPFLWVRQEIIDYGKPSQNIVEVERFPWEEKYRYPSGQPMVGMHKGGK
jgi:hypothetical protein